MLKGIDLSADLGDGTRRCVDVELPGERDLVTDAGLVVVDPGVRDLGVDLVGQVLLGRTTNGFSLSIRC